MSVLDVKKIAIIGGGASGLVSLNEFLHTDKSEISTINSLKSDANDLPEDPAFEEVVVFEQANDIGGTWNYSATTDPPLPPVKDYSNPKNIRPCIESPSKNQLLNHSFRNPLVVPIKSEVIKNDLLWNKSGVYDDLFTNVSQKLMSFTSGFDIETEVPPNENPYYPFIKHQDVLTYLQNFAKLNGLKKYIRFNTSIEKVYKDGNSWVVTAVEIDRINGVEKWYSETFDAVVLATGRFNIPFVPYIEGMDVFNIKHPNIISHTKAFRNTDDYEDKKILLVGSNISAVDLLQYMIPKCKEVWLSSNSKHVVINPSNIKVPQGQWIYDILNDKNAKFHRCARIKRFLEDGIEFEDGRIGKGFEKVLFATGYHLHYPFLEIPENKNKDYIRILSGKKGETNYAYTKADNVYLYTFTVDEPTLAYVGIAHNPLLFFTSEANAMAIAGVWSNAKKLPSLEKQREWCQRKNEQQTTGLQMLDETGFKSYARELYEYAPIGRLDPSKIPNDREVDESRLVLKKLFYQISNS